MIRSDYTDNRIQISAESIISNTKLEIFMMYKGLNANHKIMQSPYLCNMLVLTFIKGLLVEDWAANQVKALEEKVTHQVNPMLITMLYGQNS
jgi:hypothetical protein